MNKKEKQAAFDMDGTIVHSSVIYQPMLDAFTLETGIPNNSALIVAGYTEPLKYDLGFGVKLDEQPEILNRMDRFHIAEMKKGNFVPELYEGMDDVLKELNKDYYLSLVTVNRLAVSLEFLKQRDVIKYFSDWRTLCCARDRGLDIKPSPDALNCMSRKSGHRACDTVVIGDSAADIHMAHNANAKSIAARYGLASFDNVMAAEPHAYVDKPEELISNIPRVLSL